MSSDHKRELRKMEGDIELMGAHIAQLRTQIDDLTASVAVLARITAGFETRLSDLLARLKEER